MGLSDDQRAMLRMVAQRGEDGYEDIAALMGIGVDEVRARVAAALAELDAEGALTGADKAPAAATEPPAEPAPPPPAPAAAPPADKPRSGLRASLVSGTGMRAAIGAAIAIIALVAIILIVNSGGDEEPGNATAAQGQTAASETSSAKGEGKEGEANQLTKAQLTAVDGGEGEGVAIFGRVKNALALEFAAKGLQPTHSGEAYTIWLSKDKQKMLPLASTPAKNGRIGAKFKVPVEVLAYLADETFTDLVLTRTEDKQLTAALKVAAKEKSTPAYTGTEVLRGEVTGPIVGAQFRLEELKELEQEEKEAEKGEKP